MNWTTNKWRPVERDRDMFLTESICFSSSFMFTKRLPTTSSRPKLCSSLTISGRYNFLSVVINGFMLVPFVKERLQIGRARSVVTRMFGRRKEGLRAKWRDFLICHTQSTHITKITSCWKGQQVEVYNKTQRTASVKKLKINVKFILEFKIHFTVYIIT
jgi:hypothetical protein